MKQKICFPKISGLYAITPSTRNTFRLLKRVEKLLISGVRFFQYRNKIDGFAEKILQARELSNLVRSYSGYLVINDHVELAVDVDAHGVHLGVNDWDIEVARAELPPEMVVGASCYNSLDLAIDAKAKGADYVAFGSFFSSKTKPTAKRARSSIIRECKRLVNLPVVAIGGIDERNAESVMSYGADALAVSSALFKSFQDKDLLGPMTSKFIEDMNREENDIK